jgi:hypothetical protein
MPVAHPIIVTDFVDYHYLEELGETIDMFMVVRQQKLGQTIVITVGKEQELWFMSSLDDVLCPLHVVRRAHSPFALIVMLS